MSAFGIEWWTDVVGRGGSYRVSNLGRVRSIDRVAISRAGYSRRYPGRVLNPSPDKAATATRDNGRVRCAVICTRASSSPLRTFENVAAAVDYAAVFPCHARLSGLPRGRDECQRANPNRLVH